MQQLEVRWDAEFQIPSESGGTVLPPSICGPTLPAIFPLNHHPDASLSLTSKVNILTANELT